MTFDATLPRSGSRMASRFNRGAFYRLSLCALLAAGIAPAAAGAQASCTKTERAATVPVTQWQPPLDRLVSIHERGVSLRDALDRLAAAAKLRLAYPAELLPLDRRVCVSYKSISAGAALVELLDDANVEPVVTDTDRVVLAPVRPNQSAGVSAEAVSARRPGVLERVVVTGTVNGSAQRTMPVALDIVEGRELERRDARSLSSILDGSVPGISRSPPSATSFPTHTIAASA